MTKTISKWADDAMYKAETSDAAAGPQAFLIAATPDPLGSIAVAAEAYEGRFYESKDDLPAGARERYLEEMQKTILAMPLEAVQMHWRVKGVTRSFTHQMVRQRTAAYSQESMRFAVKEDLGTAVALPPSLQKFNEPVQPPEWHNVIEEGLYTRGDALIEEIGDADFESDAFGRLQKEEQHYLRWRWTVATVAQQYNLLVNDGMPAEEARGLTPHNTVTQLNYITNLRNYKDHAGLRLCTQAQFEWRMVWVRMLEAMRAHCSCPGSPQPVTGEWTNEEFVKGHLEDCDNWQWKKISELFLPVCYYKGSCQFMADFDRKCNIRERVQANAEIGRKSTEWSEAYDPFPNGGTAPVVERTPEGVVFIGPIHPAEWLLNDAAAR